MKLLTKITLLCGLFAGTLYAQKDTVNLSEVLVSANRISIPFEKNSRSIVLITAEDIKHTPADNIAELLQQIAGIDVRTRGVDGMQSDLYIRGGSFDQTLVLIDGVKMDDIQTGHHTMNAILPLEVVQRIEIIKGPAARIYGQNAFTGAVNIVTKTVSDEQLNFGVNYGSYSNMKAVGSYGQSFDNGGVLTSFTYQASDGYRYNTDFENYSGFVKSEVDGYQFLGSFTERKFGANGFYASPDYKDQYEETQTSVLAVSKVFESEKITITPRISWKRNQDMYLFLRQDPDFFRNFHISNNYGAEANMELRSDLGKTGIGVDISSDLLASSNLGNRNRTTITAFLEHRFEFAQGKFDFTPGIAMSYFSDFNTEAFPGIDLGYRISEAVKLYGNVGYTYRVPTFTDLYYKGPTTEGNPDLEPESALAEELGIQLNLKAFNFEFALFQRNSENLIDWTRENEDDKWQTQNFSKVHTKGFDLNANYNFTVGVQPQRINLGYSFIDDNIKDVDVAYARYSLNSIKHHLTSNIITRFSNIFSQEIAFRFVERTDGSTYNLMDAKFLADLNKWEISATFNNIFNEVYTETNLVPMPLGNYMLGVRYRVY